MDDEIRVESVAGKGSVFRLGLPTERPAAQISATPPAPAAVAPRLEPSRQAATPVRLLLAEDNPVNSKVALLLLERLGYAVDVAVNGREVLELLQRASYRLVLMDCQMPEMDGYEATAIIREQEGGLHRIPIVAMTANAMSGDRERCIAAGMDDYLPKPIERARLAEILAKWVPLRSAAPSPTEQTPTPGASRHELTALFLEDAPARVAELEAAVRHADRDALRRAAHQLKGTAATVGATDVARLAADLERAAGGSALESVSDLLATLHIELDRVRRIAAA
jgi:two-component system sensor histidine kinase/response regulator